MNLDPQDWRSTRDGWISQGLEMAAKGATTYDNPHPQDSPAFRYWVEGWAAYHSTGEP